MAHLVVQQDGKVSYHELAAPVTAIGRSPECALQVLDRKASRKHCQIEECERGYKIVDLESANGTVVNGLLSNHKILEAGDVIEIGAVSLTFEVEGKDVLKARKAQSRAFRARFGRASRRRRREAISARTTETEDADADGEALPGSEELPARDGIDVGADTSVGHGVTEVGSLLHPPPADQTHVGVEPATTKAELAITIRRTINALLSQFDAEGLEEVEKIFQEYTEGSVVEPYVHQLVLDRDMMAQILDINKAINSELRLEELLPKVLDESIEFTRAERGFLILLDAGGHPRVELARSFGKEPIQRPAEKFSTHIVDEVLRADRPLLTNNAMEEGRFSEAVSVSEMKLRSILCVPLRVRDRTIGVLYIDNRYESGVFDENHLIYLESIAEQAAIAIHNARLYEEKVAAQDELAQKYEQIAELNERLEQQVGQQQQELSEVKAALDRRRGTPAVRYPEIIGSAAPMERLFDLLDRVTESDVPVLITGENGTGKELVARAIHFNSTRAADGTFVSVNCAAIPPTLIESELFGHVKGAFTGAYRDKTGLFEQANQGTLFLDEIGDMPLEMQTRLLRVLEEREVRRVGGQKVTKIDVRVIAATNQDLKQLIEDGTFRQDLFFRLNVVPVRLPALRDRAEDIPELVVHMIERASEDGLSPKKIDPKVFDVLRRYAWPGNVRELGNAVRRALTLSGDVITLESFDEDIRNAVDAPAPAVRSAPFPTELPQGKGLKDVMKSVTETVESTIIKRVLDETNWKKVDAAQRLGISRPTLDAKIEAYRLKRTRRR